MKHIEISHQTCRVAVFHVPCGCSTLYIVLKIGQYGRFCGVAAAGPVEPFPGTGKGPTSDYASLLAAMGDNLHFVDNTDDKSRYGERHAR